MNTNDPYDPTQAIWPDPDEFEHEFDCDTQPVTTSVQNGDMNKSETLVNVPATYTGPTIMAAFSRPRQPVLVQGMAVRLRRIAADGSVTISYDPQDPNTPGMHYGATTLITGVSLQHLERRPGSLPLEVIERMAWEEANGLSGTHVNHTTKGA